MDDDSRSIIQKELEDTKLPLEDACLSFVEKNHPLVIESINSIYHRTLSVREYLKQYLLNHSAEIEEGKVCLVAHSSFFRIYTTKDEFWQMEANKDK